MRRPIPRGSPPRPPGYQRLRPVFTRVGAALAVGLAAAASLLLLHTVGQRDLWMPGALSGGHSQITRCHECHTRDGVRAAAADLRCQRCHDPAAAGRLGFTTHATQKTVPAGGTTHSFDVPACATCHVEHRGRGEHLAAVDGRQCHECHGRPRVEARGQPHRIADFASHPEFAVVTQVAAEGADAVEAPGLAFTHRRHLEEYLAKQRPGATLSQLCQGCHEPDAASRDFQPITFARACASCHQKDLALTASVPLGVVRTPAAAEPATCGAPSDGFACVDGGLRKTSVGHADPWILTEVARLQRSSAPAALARERTRLESEVAALQRRVVLGAPLAARPASELAELRQLFEKEVTLLEARAQVAAAPRTATLPRAAEVAGAAAAAGRTDLRQEAESLRLVAAAVANSAGATGDFETRRREVLDLLAASDAELDRRLRAAVMASPRDEDTARSLLALKRRSAALRQRLLAITPGEDAAIAAQRALELRRQDLFRVKDEETLREGGVPAQPRNDPSEARTEARLREVRAAQARLRDAESGEPSTDAAVAAASLEALLGQAPANGAAGTRCLACHVLEDGALAPVRAARPVMVLARFAHAPHLNAGAGAAPGSTADAGLLAQPTTCAACHVRSAGGRPVPVQLSDDARQLHVPGVVSCRQCHRDNAMRQDCLLCHRYHPPTR